MTSDDAADVLAEQRAVRLRATRGDETRHRADATAAWESSRRRPLEQQRDGVGVVVVVLGAVVDRGNCARLERTEHTPAGLPRGRKARDAFVADGDARRDRLDELDVLNGVGTARRVADREQRAVGESGNHDRCTDRAVTTERCEALVHLGPQVRAHLVLRHLRKEQCRTGIEHGLGERNRRQRVACNRLGVDGAHRVAVRDVTDLGIAGNRAPAVHAGRVAELIGHDARGVCRNRATVDRRGVDDAVEHGQRLGAVRRRRAERAVE